MGLENIKEIRESTQQDEVNELLNQGNWRLLYTKIDKIKVPDGKVAVGMDGRVDFFGGQTSTRYELKYKEQLVAQYILGRF